MSGRWMTAGDRFADYRSDVPGAYGDGQVGNRDTRAVLRELCRIAHDAGVAQVGVVRLQARIGISDKAIRRALARLQSDGWATRAIRGTGNRHNTTPRESVWVIHQLPDANGELWPNTEWLRDAWQGYLLTQRYQRLDRTNREAIKSAWSGVVDNPLLAVSSPPTSGQPRPHMSQGKSLKTGVHYREAERNRKQLRVVKAPT